MDVDIAPLVRQYLKATGFVETLACFEREVLTINRRPEPEPEPEVELPPEQQPSSEARLQELLARLDADMKHSLLRSEASGAGAVQRLEEREGILQRNFAAVVDLLGPPSHDACAAPSPATPSNDIEGGSPFSHHPWAAAKGARCATAS